MQPAHAVVVNAPHQPQIAQPMHGSAQLQMQPQIAQPMYAPMQQPMQPQGAVAQALPMQPQGAVALAPQMQSNPRPVAWQFVFSGACHFLCHPDLWPYALIPVVVGGIIAIVAFIVIFGTALVPQQELLRDVRAS